MKLWIVVLALLVPSFAQDKAPDPKPVPEKNRLAVLEAKSNLDDAHMQRKDLDTQIANLSNQIKQRYDAVQKQEDEAQKKFDAACEQVLKEAGLSADKWTIDTKTWEFVVKNPPPKPLPPPPTPKSPPTQ
jgi:hypothetical protein